MARSCTVKQLPTPFENQSMLQSYAERYRKIRLEALKMEPQAYSSKYETECQWPLDIYMNRLNNPLLKTFVALDTQAESTNDADDHSELLKCPWKGTLGVLGPKPASSGDITASKPPWALFQRAEKPEGKAPISTTDPSTQVVYLTVGVYVTKEARLSGIGKQLVQISHAAVREEALGLNAKSALIVVMAEMDNEGGKALYRSQGFQVVAEDTHEGSGGEVCRVLVFQKDVLADEVQG